jgi:RecA/RadA recombinase
MSVRDEIKQLDTDDIKNLINKKAGRNVAASFKDSKMLETPYWIPTGSRWLDSIICKGKIAGIPGGHITELASQQGGGKSFLALMIAKNAINMGLTVVYFDSEGGVEKDFVHKCGIDLSKIIHIVVPSMEKMFDTIDNLLTNTQNRYLFIWDSYAATPSESEMVGDYNPSSQMASAPRVANLAMKKLLVPLLERQSTLVVLNQVRDNIGADKWTLLKEPFKTPGGRSLQHAYMLRIWMLVGTSKEDALLNDSDIKIGHQVSVRIKKSRYGSEGRKCKLAFVWGSSENKIADEELWFDALEGCDKLKKGAWNKLSTEDGKEITFRANEWAERLKEPLFRKRVLQVMDDHLFNFEDPEGKTGDSLEVQD